MELTLVRAFLELAVVTSLLNDVENLLSERLIGQRPCCEFVSQSAL